MKNTELEYEFLRRAKNIKFNMLPTELDTNPEYYTKLSDNKEYLMENLQGLQVGDRVTLYRKYNSEASTSTAVQVSNVPDDGSSIRVHTLAGLCLGYIQPPERYA